MAYILPFCGFLLLSLTAAMVQAHDEPNTPGEDVGVVLEVVPDSAVAAPRYNCYIRVINAHNAPVRIQRPDPHRGDIKVEAVSSEGEPVGSTFMPTNASIGEPSFLLHPQSEMAILIGTISWEVDKPGLQNVGKVTMTSEEPIVGKAATSKKIEALVHPREYPLTVRLQCVDQVHRFGEPLPVSVVLRNDGTVTIRLINLFRPFNDYFAVVSPAHRLDRGEEKAINMRTLRTPDAQDTWLTLLPGESISLNYDLSDVFELPGLHLLRINYLQRLLIDGTDPAYTTQHIWTSNDVVVKVVAEKGVE